MSRIESQALINYARQREALLQNITAGLRSDKRFIAAWMTGSYGRGEQDTVSDLDIYVVVEDNLASDLCSRLSITNAGSPGSRLSLFEQFGEPVNIHENHRNAPPGGSFSAVLYRQPPVIVDWVLVPFRLAYRAKDTLLLFDRKGIPFQSESSVLPGASGLSGDPDQPDEAVDPSHRLAERAAFFWMMAAVTAKYIVRNRINVVDELLGMLDSVVLELAQAMKETQRMVGPWGKEHNSPAARLHGLCDQVETLGVSGRARPSVEAILRLSKPAPEQQGEVDHTDGDENRQHNAE